MSYSRIKARLRRVSPNYLLLFPHHDRRTQDRCPVRAFCRYRDRQNRGLAEEYSRPLEETYEEPDN